MVAVLAVGLEKESRVCFVVGPFRTAVSPWGQTGQSLSSLLPIGDRSPMKVEGWIEAKSRVRFGSDTRGNRFKAYQVCVCVR